MFLWSRPSVTDTHSVRSRRRLLIVAWLVTLLGSLLVPAPAAAAARFTFTGRGWGHGLGMSQWGAKGLADRGWTAAQILGRYYQGTALEQKALPSEIRVGLSQKTATVQVSGSAAFDFVHQGAVVATAPGGQNWQVARSGSGYAIRRPDGSTAWSGGGSAPVVLDYERFGVVVKLSQTGYRYKWGRIEIEYADGGFRAIGVMPFERYLYGLGEVPSSWPAETLKAQAVAARTYAAEKVARLGQHRGGCNCGLYASTIDQAYVGYEKEAGPGADRWRGAVDATAGQVVTAGGKPIQALYSSSSGGYTENNENVWGGTPLSYLRGVCDPGDYAAGQNPNANWSVAYDEPTLRSKLGRGGIDVGTIQSVRFVDPRGVSGRVTPVLGSNRGGVLVTGDRSTARLSGDRFRSLAGLKSTLIFWRISGPIRLRYDQLDCAPGLPAGEEYDWRDLDGTLRGRAQDFRAGRLTLDGRTQRVFFTSGAILAKYDALRRDGVDLGLPAGDEYAVPEGRRGDFERGSLVFNASTGEVTVVGAPGPAPTPTPVPTVTPTPTPTPTPEATATPRPRRTPRPRYTPAPRPRYTPPPRATPNRAARPSRRVR